MYVDRECALQSLCDLRMREQQFIVHTALYKSIRFTTSIMYIIM